MCLYSRVWERATLMLQKSACLKSPATFIIRAKAHECPEAMGIRADKCYVNKASGTPTATVRARAWSTLLPRLPEHLWLTCTTGPFLPEEESRKDRGRGRKGREGKKRKRRKVKRIKGREGKRRKRRKMKRRKEKEKKERKKRTKKKNGFSLSPTF